MTRILTAIFVGWINGRLRNWDRDSSIIDLSIILFGIMFTWLLGWDSKMRMRCQGSRLISNRSLIRGKLIGFLIRFFFRKMKISKLFNCLKFLYIFNGEICGIFRGSSSKLERDKFDQFRHECREKLYSLTNWEIVLVYEKNLIGALTRIITLFIRRSFYPKNSKLLPSIHSHSGRVIANILPHNSPLRYFANTLLCVCFFQQ